MASITTTKDRKRIDFRHNGKTKSVRLGKVSKKQAEGVRVHIERLLSAKITGQPLPAETSHWLASLDDTLTGRLASAGLIERIEDSSMSLIDHIDRYIDKRTDVKSSTVTVWNRTKNHMRNFFKGAQLASVTTGEAKDFRRHLLKLGLAEATVRKTCGFAKQFFEDAIECELIAKNPFKHRDIPTKASGNKSRFFFVSPDLASQVIDILPDAQWRLMFALARYGGLRCPSEVLSLRWSDIHWETGSITVTSPKTEHHEGGDSRVIPLFPELVPFLEDCHELAQPGDEFAITRYRKMDSNYGTLLTKRITQAGLTCWPKPWQNLRSTRETELAESWPIHVVCAWIGNSEAVARNHYLQVTDDHFEKAANTPHEKPQHSVATTTFQDVSGVTTKREKPLQNKVRP